MRRPDYLDALISVAGWWREYVRREPERRRQREIRARHRQEGGIKLRPLTEAQRKVAKAMAMPEMVYQVHLAYTLGEITLGEADQLKRFAYANHRA